MIKKTLLFLSLVAILVSYTSCSKIDLKYDPTNKCVTFSEESGKYSLDGKDIIVELSRGVLDGDFTVDLVLEAGSPFKLVSSSAVFKANEGKTSVSLKYDMSSLKPGVKYSFSLKISDAQKNELSPAGISTFIGSCSIPLEYVDYAEMNYSTPGILGDLVKDKKFILQRAKFTKTYYRFKGLFNSTTNFDFVLDLQTGNISDVPLKQGSLSAGDAFVVYIFPTGLAVDGKIVTAYPRVKYTLWDITPPMNPNGPQVGDKFYSNMWANNGTYLNGAKAFDEQFSVTKLL